MKISAYKDFGVNYANGSNLHTTGCTTQLPEQRGGIGRVDHFMKQSIKAIVNAAVRQVIKREGKTGRHTITITYHAQDLVAGDLKYGPKQTLVVTVDV